MSEANSRVASQEQELQLTSAADALRAGDARQAESITARVLAVAPGHPGAHYLAALACDRQGRLRESIEHMVAATAGDPDNAEYHFVRSELAYRAGDLEHALSALESGLEREPDRAQDIVNKAALLSELGRIPEAIAAYEQALALDPDFGRGHYGLAVIKEYRPGDPQIAQMEQLYRRPDLDEEDRYGLAFALGRAHEQCGNYRDAFTYFREGNAIRRRTVQFDLAQERANAREIIASTPGELFEGRDREGCRDDTPVFVVGMPRSGTTLVEQILASHPQVAGAGEIMDLPRAVYQTLAGSSASRLNLPRDLARVPPAVWRHAGEMYARGLRERHPGAERIVDKMPFNYTMLCFIALMLPNARIIHCRRDPMDTCVSCFTTAFGKDRGFTYDLAEVGGTYVTYRALMSHWHDVLPGRILDVDYESMVDDLEGGARRMIDYLGLPWDESCLAFHANAREVRTASLAQVRRPVYASSVGKWKNYEPWLEPLITALSQELDRE
ncbi:MAG: sulfotransferase [Gammaproteobacteria bacterium]